MKSKVSALDGKYLHCNDNDDDDKKRETQWLDKRKTLQCHGVKLTVAALFTTL